LKVVSVMFYSNQKYLEKLGTVVRTCNPSTWKAKAGESWVGGQPRPGLHKKTLSLKLTKTSLENFTSGLQPSTTYSENRLALYVVYIRLLIEFSHRNLPPRLCERLYRQAHKLHLDLYKMLGTFLYEDWPLFQTFHVI
jgi:hypothetical protein